MNMKKDAAPVTGAALDEKGLISVFILPFLETLVTSTAVAISGYEGSLAATISASCLTVATAGTATGAQADDHYQYQNKCDQSFHVVYSFVEMYCIEGKIVIFDSCILTLVM